MTNQELIRKLQSRIKKMSNAMSGETVFSDIHPIHIEEQKFNKKLLSALYEAEKVVKQLEELEGSVIGFISRMENWWLRQ